MKSIQIGTGAGYSGDRIEPAIELAEKADIAYLVFECLAERTIALAQQARLYDPDIGYDPLLTRRIEAVLATCMRRGIRIVTNMGAANPVAAARAVAAIGRQLGLTGLKVAAVSGDDVLAPLRAQGEQYPLLELPGAASSLGDRIVSANAYVGAEPIVEALAGGAHVVITGRSADPSLFLAPLIHEFGWSFDDWTLLGRGTVVGHLMECAGQVTGGYFADPGFKDVPNLARLGFPIAEVWADGRAVITKVPGSGGRVDVATCTEQLLYELHDPTRYLTPDVTADFSGVQLVSDGPDRVAVSGGAGVARPETLKVSIGYRDGFIGEGQISYAGPGAADRGRLALDIVAERLRLTGVQAHDLRFELIGVDAICRHRAPEDAAGDAPFEVRARVAGRTATYDDAMAIGNEVDTLYTNGPAGGGGATRAARSVLAIASTLIPRTLVQTHVSWETV